MKLQREDEKQYFTIGDSPRFVSLRLAQETCILYNRLFGKGHGLQMVQPHPKPQHYLKRYRALVAWNGWPDNKAAHVLHSKWEERDPFSANAWDRVIDSIEEGHVHV